MVFLRSNLETDMLILESCIRLTRFSDISKFVHHSSDSTLMHRLTVLSEKGLLNVDIVDSKYRSGSGKMSLAKNPKKYQRKVYQTTSAGAKLIGLWKQLKEAYEYESKTSS